jgi:hypothetical protein
LRLRELAAATVELSVIQARINAAVAANVVNPLVRERL